MQLLPEEKLVWSPIVANSRMNRSRNSSGINSYEKEFLFKPEDYLLSTIKSKGSASWLDLCCGDGIAIVQVSRFFSSIDLSDSIKLKGVDLVDTVKNDAEKKGNLTFEFKSLIDWEPDRTYDLITCVHGLHYIGDKLLVVKKAINALNENGLFVANLSAENIVVDGQKNKHYLAKVFKAHDIEYNGRRKIIRKEGALPVDFGFKYLGADDKYGPNYTGQESVTSYYAK